MQQCLSCLWIQFEEGAEYEPCDVLFPNSVKVVCPVCQNRAGCQRPTANQETKASSPLISWNSPLFNRDRIDAGMY